MKVLILAGGFGTRLSEETGIRPKPMVEIGGYPILWHIMKTYAEYGFNEFVILLGYKGDFIKQYFLDYVALHSDMTIDMKSGDVSYLRRHEMEWKVTLLDTGSNTMTGGRVKRAQEILNGEPFMLTYGDGVSDINIAELAQFHKEHKRLITMTSVVPDGRFGRMQIDADNTISSFIEKPKEENWINGGFFVCENKVLDYITEGDASIFERKPLEALANEHQLMAYKHFGFWKCMDTLSDKNNLEKMWQEGAPWKIWK
ncbi:MAG: glucose-1-phosphate cytidylyltransferase [Chitinophagales bacterium]|jgi:glucose-1-phosphate cytidylyltransferase|nr:glucose-1-phosphate cytidylyltransferase [Chitinophagales bacterium]